MAWRLCCAIWVTTGSWDNSQNSPAVQAFLGLTVVVGLGWGKADLLKLQLQLTSPSPHTWAPAPWKRHPSNESCSCREGFFLAVADSDFRAVDVELESSTEREGQEVSDSGKWETQGRKDLTFFPSQRCALQGLSFHLDWWVSKFLVFRQLEVDKSITHLLDWTTQQTNQPTTFQVCLLNPCDYL